MTGTRPGSRAHALQALKPGHSLLFEAPGPSASGLMAQIAADIARLRLAGRLEQSKLIAIDVHTLETCTVVRVTRKE